MNVGDALLLAIQAGRNNTFVLGDHAINRMFERNVTRKDIANALKTATGAELETEIKFKITGGVDLAGVTLGVVIVFAWHTKIVTVF